jgi:hypothetical protein
MILIAVLLTAFRRILEKSEAAKQAEEGGGTDE